METIGFAKYDTYKDSEVEWIGEVPQHWELRKFKRIFYEVKKRTKTELGCGAISFGKVVYKDDEKIPESTKRSYQVVLKGDFLINPLNLNYDLISLRIALSEINVVVSSGYIVLVNSIEIDKSYFKWLLHRFDVAFMKLLGSGVRQTLNYNDIGNCDLTFPPLSEQTDIASFLNIKTTQIDLTIAQKGKQIELLKERRLTMINEVVTRGLDPYSPLVDSGMTWVGKMPKHWTTLRLKYVFKILKRIANELGHHVLSITQTGIKVKDVESGEGQLAMDYSKYQFVYKGDLAMNHMDLLTGYVDISKFDGVISPDYRVFDLIDPSFIKEYFLLLLQLCYKNKAFYANGQGVSMLGRWRFPTENFNNFLFPIPPIEEQRAIAEHVSKFNNKIETAITCKQGEIERLKEYKATLINSAVTGKIKVS